MISRTEKRRISLYYKKVKLAAKLLQKEDEKRKLESYHRERQLLLESIRFPHKSPRNGTIAEDWLTKCVKCKKLMPYCECVCWGYDPIVTYKKKTKPNLDTLERLLK